MLNRFKQVYRQSRLRTPSLFIITDLFYELLHAPKDIQQMQKMFKSLKHKSIKEIARIVCNDFKAFQPIQKLSEIGQLLDLLEKEKPQRICEIGGCKGGTILLFAQCASLNAQLVSIDIAYTPLRPFMLKPFLKTSQDAKCLRANSHNPQLISRIQSIFSNELVDFLFIDGDHSYPGIKNDFSIYSRLVRPGGIIAFHDIVPDWSVRGIKTLSDTGGVPQFWSELKQKYKDNIEEFIEDPNQNGYGIGVLYWPEPSN